MMLLHVDEAYFPCCPYMRQYGIRRDLGTCEFIDIDSEGMYESHIWSCMGIVIEAISSTSFWALFNIPEL